MKRIIGLDSLRFFAIILIIAYHANRYIIPGGFIAVEIFFCLSGFLIARKLLKSFQCSKLSFPKFLWSRIKKFYPPMILTAILALSIGYFANPDLITKAGENTLSALTFSTNISEILNNGSYEAQIIPNIFEHFWFLAIEIQACIIFYIFLWLIIGIFQNSKNNARISAIICFVLGVASYFLMALLGGKYNLYDRAYFGTDSHMGAFLFGAALSCLLINYPDYKQKTKHKLLYYSGIIISFSIIIYLSLTTQYSNSSTFYYVLPMVSLLTVWIIYGIIKLQNKKSKNCKILNFCEYVGQLSFYIYLFHWPLLVLLPSFIPIEPWISDIIAISISVVLAIISKEGISVFFHKMWTGKWWQRIIVGLITAGLLVIPILSILKAPSTSSIEQQLNGEAVAYEQQKNEEKTTPHIDFGNSEKTISSLGSKITPILSLSSKHAAIPAPRIYVPAYVDYGYNSAANASSARVLVIGDSVTLGAKSSLESSITNIYVDAAGSRGIDQAIPLLAAYKANGGLPNIIVISLITNYRTITEATWQSIIDVGGADKQYVLVTGYCGSEACGDGRYSRSAQNNTIYNFVNSHSNVYLADWYNLAVNDYSLTGSDNIHLTPIGRSTYASLIKQVVDNL